MGKVKVVEGVVWWRGDTADNIAIIWAIIAGKNGGKIAETAHDEEAVYKRSFYAPFPSVSIIAVRILLLSET